MLKRSGLRLFLCIDAIADFPALHVDNWVMPVLARRRGRHSIDIFGVSGF
jgi:hypothetical protein